MNQTTGETRTCGLIGHPVAHTLSPLIHNTLAAETDMDLVYVPFDVESTEALHAAVEGAAALGVAGLNVTVPYKRDVMRDLREIDPAAKRIGAVNTLVPLSEGGFKGYNTDLDGLYRALTASGASIEGDSVLILGAGGVARPAAFLCADRGAREIFILNRTLVRAEELADEVNEAAGRRVAYGMSLADHRSLPVDRKYLCLQCTSVGLDHENEAVISEPAFYHRLHTAFDAVYRPMETRFLRLAREAGARTISGLTMLLYQGIRAYELWFPQVGRIPEEQAQVIYEALHRACEGETIILIGFMGSGKTTVAGLLSEHLGLPMRDTDDMIVREQGMSVKEIFERFGEEAFREMETECVRKLTEHGMASVLSVGGGLPMRPENRVLLHRLGKVFYLRTSPQEVYNRLQGDASRPLLAGANPMDRIETLQREREEQYLEAADFVIDTDGCTPEEVMALVLRMQRGEEQ